MANNNNLADSLSRDDAVNAKANIGQKPAEKNLQTFYSTILKTDPVIFGHQFYITFSRY